jgi:hypothetical protein
VMVVEVWPAGGTLAESVGGVPTVNVEDSTVTGRNPAGVFDGAG